MCKLQGTRSTCLHFNFQSFDLLLEIYCLQAYYVLKGQIISEQNCGVLNFPKKKKKSKEIIVRITLISLLNVKSTLTDFEKFPQKKIPPPQNRFFLNYTKIV